MLRHGSFVSELTRIRQSEGIPGLWSGLPTSLLVASISSPVQTLVADALQRHLPLGLTGQKRHEANLSRLASLITMMIISRCTATAVTYPLSLVQSQQRVSPQPKDKPHSLVQSLRHLLRENGPAGLFKGLQGKLLQTSLLTGLLAFTHPRIVLYILKLYQTRTSRVSAGIGKLE